jgi:hypothetical protein
MPLLKKYVLDRPVLGIQEKNMPLKSIIFN